MVIKNTDGTTTETDKLNDLSAYMMEKAQLFFTDMAVHKVPFVICMYDPIRLGSQCIGNFNDSHEDTGRVIEAVGAWLQNSQPSDPIKLVQQSSIDAWRAEREQLKEIEARYNALVAVQVTNPEVKDLVNVTKDGIFKVIDRWETPRDQYTAGWHIVTGPDENQIYGLGRDGMDAATLKRCKAMVEYWCLHLNQAYMAGRLSYDGLGMQHSPESWARLDELYRIAHGLDTP